MNATPPPGDVSVTLQQDQEVSPVAPEGTSKQSLQATMAPPGTTEAVTAAQKAVDTMALGELPVGLDEAKAMAAMDKMRRMEFVGVDVDGLCGGLFSTIRVGRRWADLSVGEAERLVCTDEAGGPAVSSVVAMVVHVVTGTVHDLIRGHSATNFSVRGEANPETRELALAVELRGHYDMGPGVVTRGGTVVYLMPYDAAEDRWITSADDMAEGTQAERPGPMSPDEERRWLRDVSSLTDEEIEEIVNGPPVH